MISTKLFFSTTQGPNAQGLSRKHLVEGAKTSLKRLTTDYVDVIFCHRPEKSMPIEEVVRGMNFVINQGLAFYWGASDWHESDILQACEIADRLGLIHPIAEQPQYNLVNRTRIEVEFDALFKKYKLGLTTWSLLAFGVLTGKYANGFPEGTRLANDFYKDRFDDVNSSIANTEKLRPIAAKLGCLLAQLALAWTASNTNVSTVLLSAKAIEQLDENLKASPIVAQITSEIKQKIEAAMPFTYGATVRDQFYTMRETTYV